MDGDTMVIMSRRVGDNQPIIGVDPNGQAQFGRADIGLSEPLDPENPITATNVRF